MITSMTGIADLPLFLEFLSDNKVSYNLTVQRDGYVMVNCGGYGVRIEVEFSSETIEFSVFKGSEDVETDLTKLEKLIIDSNR